MTVEAVARRLKLKPWDGVRRRELELYAEVAGPAALERQVELGLTHHRCCWAPKDGAHTVGCPVGRRGA